MSSPYKPPESAELLPPTQLGQFVLARPGFLIASTLACVVARVVATAGDVLATLTMEGWNQGSAEVSTLSDGIAVAMTVAGGLAALGLSLLTAVLFWIWIHRANRNANALGALGMEYTPGWCVAWWLIPLANLFKPVKTVMEVYKASDPERGPDDWKEAPDASLITNWWTSWLLSYVLERASATMSKSDKPELAEMSTWVGLGGTALAVYCGFALYKLVGEIQTRQWAKADALLNPTTED